MKNLTRTGGCRRGSVLMMALWLIAVLSLMVISFAYEAKQQAGVDLYVRERNRVKRTVESGKMLAEAVLLDFANAPEPEISSGKIEWDDYFEKDRWVREKYELKTTRECVIGPLRLDDEQDEDGEDIDPSTIKVEIKAENSVSGIAINSLYPNGDKNYLARWQTILTQCGIDEEQEVEVEEAGRSGSKRHNLMNLLIASWCDWRDDDDNVTRGPLEENDPLDDDGAEKAWYEERDEEDEIPVKERRLPANGPIKKLEELSFIRGFRDFPAVLTGGLLHPDEKESPENPRLSGILRRFKATGDSKIILNEQTRAEDLSTVPGLFADDPEDESEVEDKKEIIDAILGALKTMPEDDDNIDRSRTWWPFKDFSDMCQRVDDYGCDLQIPDEVREYLQFASESGSSTSSGSASSKSSESSQDGKKSSSKSGASGSSVSADDLFSVTITCESLGMRYTVKASCTILDSKVRYLEWSENEADGLSE